MEATLRKQQQQEAAHWGAVSRPARCRDGLGLGGNIPASFKATDEVCVGAAPPKGPTSHGELRALAISVVARSAQPTLGCTPARTAVPNACTPPCLFTAHPLSLLGSGGSRAPRAVSQHGAILLP